MKNIISLPNFGGFYEETFTDNWAEDWADYAATKESEPAPEIDYQATYQAVSRHIVEAASDGYADRLKEEFPGIVTGVEYDSLDSPKYYNFRTDEILAVIDYDYILLNNQVFVQHREAFAAWLKANYTSRDGFISFIETDVQDFIEALKGEQPTDTETPPAYSTYLTVIFQFLCREWENVIPEEFEGVQEHIVTK